MTPKEKMLVFVLIFIFTIILLKNYNENMDNSSCVKLNNSCIRGRNTCCRTDDGKETECYQNTCILKRQRNRPNNTDVMTRFDSYSSGRRPATRRSQPMVDNTKMKKEDKLIKNSRCNFGFQCQSGVCNSNRKCD